MVTKFNISTFTNLHLVMHANQSYHILRLIGQWEIPVRNWIMPVRKKCIMNIPWFVKEGQQQWCSQGCALGV